MPTTYRVFHKSANINVLAKVAPCCDFHTIYIAIRQDAKWYIYIYTVAAMRGRLIESRGAVHSGSLRAIYINSLRPSIWKTRKKIKKTRAHKAIGAKKPIKYLFNCRICGAKIFIWRNEYRAGEKDERSIYTVGLA